MLRRYLWGVSPLDDFTNEALARELSKTSDATDEAITKDKDGNELRLYIVEYNFINRLSRLTDERFKFLVYIKEGGSSWRAWNLFRKKKPTKKVKDLLKKLKNK